MKRRGEQTRRHVVREIAPYDPRSPKFEQFEAQEYKFRRDTAASEWQQLRKAILAEGGIRPTKGIGREDISQIPSSVIRSSSKFTPDQFATWYGYDHVDDFADFVGTVYGNYSDTKRPPRRPRRLPKIKHMRNRRPRMVKISRKPHPSKPPAAKTTSDGRKWVIVKAHTRSCPK